MEKNMKYELIEERNLFSTFGITDGLSESELEQVGGDINICFRTTCSCNVRTDCTCNVKTNNTGY